MLAYPRIDEAMADQLQSPVLPEDLVSEAIPGMLGTIGLIQASGFGCREDSGLHAAQHCTFRDQGTSVARSTSSHCCDVTLMNQELGLLCKRVTQPFALGFGTLERPLSIRG